MLNDDGQTRKGIALPFEIFELIDKRCDMQTHTRLRATCQHFRQFLPLEKFVDFKTLKELKEKYLYGWNTVDRDSRRAFQERVHLDISPSSLTPKQFEYLRVQGLDYENCRISRAALDRPFAYKHIDLLSDSRLLCDSFRAAAVIGDIDLMQRLLQIPNVDPASRLNSAIRVASAAGQLESVRLLLKVPTVDASYHGNDALRGASRNGHNEVCKLLLTNARVRAYFMDDPCDLPVGVVVPPLV